MYNQRDMMVTSSIVECLMWEFNPENCACMYACVI